MLHVGLLCRILKTEKGVVLPTPEHFFSLQYFTSMILNEEFRKFCRSLIHFNNRQKSKSLFLHVCATKTGTGVERENTFVVKFLRKCKFPNRSMSFTI